MYITTTASTSTFKRSFDAFRIHQRRPSHYGRGTLGQSGNLFANSGSNVDDGDELIVDATIVEETDNSSGEISIAERTQSAISDAIRKLASLSLEDYKWRSAMFKANEADRKVEESLARMSGEEPFYIRPMHASEDKLGPLGNAEKQAVEWLSNVIEEEGKRAQRIAEGEGTLLRPMDVEEGAVEKRGPLSELERNAVNFFRKIVDSETERLLNGKLRPMQLEESKRGPLGEAEARAVTALQELTEAEMLRAKQQQARGGDVVRPIDIPGPLGEFERTAVEIYTAEQQRMRDKTDRGLAIVRPKDASIEGPLGKAEREAVEAIDRLLVEEEERARSIRRLMEKKRPMDNDRDSPLGLVEALTVGILRGPKLLVTVYDRVRELILSEELELEQDERSSLSEVNDDNIGTR